MRNVPGLDVDNTVARRVTDEMHGDPFTIVKKYKLESRENYIAPIKLSTDVREQYELVKPAVRMLRNQAIGAGSTKLSEKYSLEEIAGLVDKVLGPDKQAEKKAPPKVMGH